MEIWKDIAEAPGYQVSSNGQVRSLRRKAAKILNQIMPGDYLSVVIIINGEKKQTRTVHRLVAKAFIPNPENKPEVNHINGDKLDNRVENLEWVTRSENMRHAYRNGLLSPASLKALHPSKLTDEQVVFIRSVYKPFDREYGATALAIRFGVCSRTIQDAIRGRTYKNVDGELHPPTVCGYQKIPAHCREEIRACYQKGISGAGLTPLAKRFGVSTATITKILREKE